MLLALFRSLNSHTPNPRLLSCFVENAHNLAEFCSAQELDEENAVIFASPVDALPKDNIKVKRRRASSLFRNGSFRHSSSVEIADTSVCATRIRRINRNKCKVEILFDFRGKFKKIKSLDSFVDYRALVALHDSFLHWLALDDLTGKDGVKIGRLLMARSKGKSKQTVEQRVAGLCRKSRAMKELASKFPRLEAMLGVVIKNKLITGWGGENENDAEVAQATRIGSSFAALLVTTTEPSAAVDSWRLDNPTLKPLFDHPFFTTMMREIAQELLARSNFGLRWRVVLGAGLSISDLISDSFVVVSYHALGEVSAAQHLLAMLCLSILFQLMVSLWNNRKRRKRDIVRELAIVLLGMKPGVDAYRVATRQVSEGQIISPLFDMVWGKCLELAWESIPGGLLQTYIFISSPTRTTFQFVSILISTLTTGFASALISYDMETSVDSRREGERAKRASLLEDEHTRDEVREMASDGYIHYMLTHPIRLARSFLSSFIKICLASLGAVPLFYGYIGDANWKRGATFLLLMLLASLHNLCRTFGTALLMAVSGTLTIYVMIMEMVVYHLYRILRRDYVLWIVGLEGMMTWFVAILVHSLLKVLVDFTGFVHARGPKLFGGTPFIIATLVSICLPHVALRIYDADETLENKMNAGQLNSIFIGLTSLWFVCVVLFFSIINSEYYSTFYGFITGWQVSVSERAFCLISQILLTFKIPVHDRLLPRE